MANNATMDKSQVAFNISSDRDNIGAFCEIKNFSQNFGARFARTRRPGRLRGSRGAASTRTSNSKSQNFGASFAPTRRPGHPRGSQGSASTRTASSEVSSMHTRRPGHPRGSQGDASTRTASSESQNFGASLTCTRHPGRPRRSRGGASTRTSNSEGSSVHTRRHVGPRRSRGGASTRTSNSEVLFQKKYFLEMEKNNKSSKKQKMANNATMDKSQVAFNISSDRDNIGAFCEIKNFSRDFKASFTHTRHPGYLRRSRGGASTRTSIRRKFCAYKSM
ncbi:hypothetical protein JTE90_022970 [Oedothorax gibbosus]|uniref:Uncharacterized protein n=1 Tax=Oedothorax gibbosus TaxID=931172 RepID=A0AAV6VBL7_9ARAC|nr:hypothetical protein JTE90_022970 [Oedothorax gibbosus]